MRCLFPGLACGVVLILTLATPAAAVQDGGDVVSPHGDLAEPCASCHSPQGWSPARVSGDFDHGDFGFPLDGAHEQADCMGCHQDLRFSATGSECADCHADVHQGELGLDCGRCHGTRSFIDVADQRRMHRDALFPLTGAHASVPCESCHEPTGEGTLRFLGTPDDCFVCHEAEYLSVDDPDHVADGFLQECEFCHSTRTFAGGIFNHERQLAGMPLICVECHQGDYDATRDPDHESAGFPVDCQACHDTRRWEGATFAHDGFFPIDSGAHREEWETCVDCHVEPTNYAVFSCLGCHPHSDQQKTDSDHDEEPDYLYDSIECYDCHPRGRS